MMTNRQPPPIRAKLKPDHDFFDCIESAYRVFESPKPASIEVCEGCCMEADIEADFFRPGIRDLPLHYLQDWFFAACDPQGIAKQTWAYLLPRILEVLAADEDLASVGVEVSLARFDTGNPDQWTHEQWAVLDQFQRSYLTRHIESEKPDPLDDVLCMFTLGGWSIDDLLDQVWSSPDEVLTRRLWRDWCQSAAKGQESIWITAFWKSPGNEKAYVFYTSERLRSRMEALALSDDTDPDLAAKASAVVDVIERNRD